MDKKIIISEELKNILNQIDDNSISKTLYAGEISESLLIDPEKQINYLDVSHTTKGHMSYLNKERIDKIEAGDKDFWKVKMRYHSRPGSALKKLFKPEFSRSIEDFSMKYLSIVDKPIFRMELVKGIDIPKYYNYRNYYNNSGNLGCSCMSRVPSEFFDFYSKNEKSINMLVMLDQDDKVMGRAIVWNCEDCRIMDRIYTCNDLYENYFRNWAKENNVYYKEYNNFKTPLHMVTPEGEKIFKKCVIELEQTLFDRYPYLDTFKWLDVNKKKLYNYIPEDINPVDFKVLCDSMGDSYPYNIYAFDDMTNEIHNGIDIEYLDYLDVNVFNGHICHSYTLNRNIYVKHAKYDDTIKDNIFNSEYEHLNDYSKIEKRKIELEEKRTIFSSKLKEMDIQLWDRHIDVPVVPVEDYPMNQ